MLLKIAIATNKSILNFAINSGRPLPRRSHGSNGCTFKSRTKVEPYYCAQWDYFHWRQKSHGTGPSERTKTACAQWSVTTRLVDVCCRAKPAAFAVKQKRRLGGCMKTIVQISPNFLQNHWIQSPRPVKVAPFNWQENPKPWNEILAKQVKNFTAWCFRHFVSNQQQSKSIIS